MPRKVKPIPSGFHTVTPYLLAKDATGLIQFLKKAFAARTISAHKRPDGSIMHAQLQIGDSMVMLGQAQGPWQPMPCLIHLYVTDADAWFRRALKAGATSVMEPTDQFYGDRSGGVKDAEGNMWWVSTHIEDVPPKEMKKRMATACK